MELKMNDYLLPEKILFNYKELKQELTEKIAHYETLVYTDEQIKDAKADRAALNKLKKALNDEKIRVKKEYIKPFEEFEKKINEVINIIDKPVGVIDKQIKQYEEKVKQEKLEDIKELWKTFDAPESLPFEKVFQEKFLNVSCSMKVIAQYMRDSIDKFERDMQTLEELPEFSFEAQQVYIETCDINKALAEGRKMAAIQKKKEEYQKEQEREQCSDKGQEELYEKDTKEWVSFSALLSTKDAIALREFFLTRKIEFGPVLNDDELYCVKEAFQGYYYAEINKIAEKDKVIKTLFEKIGII